MRKTSYCCAALLAVVTFFGSCALLHDSTGSPPAPNSTVTKTVASDIVFRANYFLSKECRRGPHGEYALGMWGVCEVIEVLEGELKLKYLKGVEVPAGVENGKAYTFRWKTWGADRKQLREAEASGFAGIWLLGVTLELVRAGEREH